MTSRPLRSRASLFSSLLVRVVASAWIASSAFAAVPGETSYQGLLLDDQGDPVTATVAMEFELFDAPAGGAALWYESHPAVQVVDGVYDVVLGAITPIDQAVVEGGAIHLEVTVEGETLTPRTQLLMVPYALRAEVAENVGGIESGYITQMLEYFQFDGQSPENLHPDEGLGDTDGDGRANFVDADNDGDGILDGDELAQGSNINVVTPTISGFSPASADGFESTVVTVSGTSFVAGMTVAFGSQNPTPSNITPTSFDVTVGSQPEGDASVTVTLPNAESTSGSFPFFLIKPTVTGFAPDVLDEGQAATITLTGTNFEPGMTAQFGTQSPTPTNVTPTSLDIAVAGTEPPGFPLITVTLPNGKSWSGTGVLINTGSPRTIFLSAAASMGDLGGLSGADATCQSEADAAGLTGTYQAWLADGVASPATRESRSGAPYIDPLGTVIADDWADLTDGTLDFGISVTAASSTVSTPVPVWSGVAAVGGGGTGTPSHCQGWTSSSSGVSGRQGLSGTLTSDWTDTSSGIACNFERRFYCVEQ